ncbi:MAG TPA: response regulator, partial [Plasticicumulans sp.]|nr:response regulator [Plasticicumulans sp.]
AGSSEARPPVLLFRSADMRAAIQVDAVLGRQEIIVKPVGPQLSAVPGVSGATVLADGRVVIILDMPALVRGLASAARRAQEAAALRAARQADERAPLSILVVDDSITMRKVTARVLERHGVVVELAKDGVDAVEVLDQLVPDLVILDIEMPRMDGFELVGHIRNQARLRHLPVIMVTSRTGEKHRDRAARLGVNAYLGKPYQEEELLGSIRDVLGSEGARRLRSL